MERRPRRSPLFPYTTLFRSLEVGRHSRALEIGAGSGYQTAVLSRLAGQVYAIERIPELAREAQARIRSLGIYNARSEEHTSELQSRQYLVCRLLLEKKKELK